MNANAMSIALDFLLLATAWTHVLVAPYNKVEESFSLHAMHDVLSYGVGPTALHTVRRNISLTQ
jgi:alpha-1,6-mannosyltransferase